MFYPKPSSTVTLLEPQGCLIAVSVKLIAFPGGMPGVALWFSLLPVLDPPCVIQTAKIIQYCVMSMPYTPPLLPQLLFSQMPLRHQTLASVSMITHLTCFKIHKLWGKHREGSHLQDTSVWGDDDREAEE